MRKKLIIMIPILLLIAFLLWSIWISTTLTTTTYDYQSNRVPISFDGFTIVQLSDIHCKNYGEDNQQLIDMINALEPDIIFITGDCVDRYHPSLAPLENLFTGITNSAPIYAISGNHECANRDLYVQLLALYQKYGIVDLDDKEIHYSNGTDSIILKGLGAFYNKIEWDKNFMENQSPDTFSIFLDHYPQLNQLGRYGYDIILAGHIHGGIIRLPGIGGIIGNGGTLFPKYSGGVYKLWKSTMYVSRGIGDAIIPRINNNPEIVCITLHHTND